MAGVWGVEVQPYTRNCMDTMCRDKHHEYCSIT